MMKYISGDITTVIIITKYYILVYRPTDSVFAQSRFDVFTSKKSATFGLSKNSLTSFTIVKSIHSFIYSFIHSFIQNADVAVTVCPIAGF